MATFYAITSHPIKAHQVYGKLALDFSRRTPFREPQTPGTFRDH